MMMDVEDRLAKPTGELFDALLESIRAFSVDHEFADDVCLIGMEYNGKPGLQS
jgi:serine phosphatase RsbU (regulator of sigma subunit)